MKGISGNIRDVRREFVGKCSRLERGKSPSTEFSVLFEFTGRTMSAARATEPVTRTQWASKFSFDNVKQ